MLIFIKDFRDKNKWISSGRFYVREFNKKKLGYDLCLNRRGTAETFETGGSSAHRGPEPQGEGSGQGRAREGSSRFHAMGWTRLRWHDVIATKLRVSLDEKSPVFLPHEPDQTSNKTKCNERRSRKRKKNRFVIADESSLWISFMVDWPSIMRARHCYCVSLSQVGYSDCLPTVLFFPKFLKNPITEKPRSAMNRSKF